MQRRAVRRAAAAFAALLLLAGTAVAQQVPTSEAAFTDFVAQRVRAAVRPMPVEIKGPLTLTIGPLQANLDRIQAFCRTADRAGCLKEIDTYVNGVVQATRTATAKPAKDSLRVVVRQAADMQRAVEQLGASGVATTRPLVEGLVIVPVLDSSRTTKILAAPDLAALGLSPEQAVATGLANVRSRLKPIMTVAKPMPAGQFGHITGDYYESSRLALIDSWAPLAQAQGGVLIVAAPSPDLVLYSGEDSPTAIDALRTLAANLTVRAPKPLSNMLLRWTPKGWQRVR
ncbi:hypothetical protein SSBR45G_52150 [Bradyrhizobium sp. SSBR45G]|nr:hypothetical protein SSBR45G_52150 [Bradyrhizobium sp. SSBR45G]GLH87800.1 hypothetical protein SSBR45R_52600 [Bradyrhizobium sp. SSBR45R]